MVFHRQQGHQLVQQFAQAFGEQGVGGGGQVGARVDEAIATDQAKALPEHGAAQQLAFTGAELAHRQHQAPATIPGGRAGGVDVARGVFDALLTTGRQQVVGLAAMRLGAQPAFLYQSKHGSADQAFADAQRLEQADQTAQPDASSTRMDGIAEYGNDDGAGAYATLLAERIDMGLGEGNRHAGAA